MSGVGTYAKLRDGSWGVRLEGDSVQGTVILVKKRSGETKQERLAARVWSGNGVSLWSIDSGEARQSSRVSSARARSGNGCSECRQTATRTAQIWEECDRCGTEPVYR